MSAKLGNCCRTGAQEEIKLTYVDILGVFREYVMYCALFFIVFHCFSLLFCSPTVGNVLSMCTVQLTLVVM